MATTLRKPFFLFGIVLIFLLGAGLVWGYMNAPMFVQLGETHYLAGGQLYVRTQGEGYADYTATKQTFWEAAAADPNPFNWLPVKISLVE